MAGLTPPPLSRAFSLPSEPQSTPSAQLATTAEQPGRAQQNRRAEVGKIPAHIVGKRPLQNGPDTHSCGEVPKLLGASDAHREGGNVPANLDTLEGDGPDLKVLEGRLEEEQRARTYLEGQLEAVKEECEAALEGRPKLLSMLSRAETELAEMAAALERERAKRHDPTPESFLEDVSAAKQAAKNLKAAEQALAMEKRAVSDLKDQLSKRERKSRSMEKGLEDARQNLRDQESDLTELRDKLQKVHAETTEKANGFEEMVSKVSSLEAGYESLEQSKSWLHDQLQEAQRAKLRLQEELRESKASGIAHEIRCDQLQKENVAHQGQIANLLQGVLQDKAKMVSQLETIKEDVLSHEDLYAKLIAEKSQLEDAVERKGEALSQLGSEAARAQVKQEELRERVDETCSENETLARKSDDLERENKRLSHKLGCSVRDFEEKESDLKEVAKIKAVLQEKLRSTDAETVSKDGTIQSLKDANELLQQELDLVAETKGNLERELVESKCELAMLETELKAALDKCKERDSRLRDALESQHSTGDQKRSLRALLAEKGKELDQKEQDIKSMESQMAELLKDFGSLQDNFKSIASESGSVTSSIAEKDRVISHLSSEKDVRDEELHLLGSENQDMRDKLAHLQHEKAHLVGQIEGSVDQEDYRRALQDKAQLQEELNSLRVDQKRDEIKAQAKINRLESDTKAAQKTASRAQAELQSYRNEANGELSAANETRQRMEGDLRVASENLQRALDDKEKTENALSSRKPSKEKIEGILKSKCEQLRKQNDALMEQLQHVTQQKGDIERASGLVAARLKQNAEKEKTKLVEKNRETSLELERLRGRLAGMHTTQVTVRDHATNLEVALAKKESSIVKLSAEAQKVLEDKLRDDEAFKTQVVALEKQLRDLNVDVAFQREHAEHERQQAETLERELRTHKSLSDDKQASESTSDRRVVSRLNDQLAALSLEKDTLQSDASYLKSQLLIAKTSAESSKRQIADRASQVEILERELRLAESRTEQAEEEVRRLQDHLKAGKARHEAELVQERSVRDMRDRGVKGDLDSTNQAGANESQFGGSVTGSDVADSGIEKTVKLDDTLRELGSRVAQARLQGQEAAELKKSGEISVLQEELGSKSKTLSTLQSYLHGLKDDMNKLHTQMDHHSTSMRESYKSSRLIESQIEDLRRNSSLPSPFMLSTPTEQSQ